jgi:hypothetical protein
LVTSIQCEGNEDFRIVVVICCVWGNDTPIRQNLSNTQKIWQLSEGDEKPIPALKINILWDMADSIPYFVPTQFQKSIFIPITRPKIPALRRVSVSNFKITKKLHGSK